MSSNTSLVLVVLIAALAIVAGIWVSDSAARIYAQKGYCPEVFRLDNYSGIHTRWVKCPQ